MVTKKAQNAKSAQEGRATKVEDMVKSVSKRRQKIKSVEVQSIDWNVAGFTSAAITLLGGSLLFMLGWAYEANWYGYFGVNMTQVAVQPQDVLIQSIPGVVTLVSCLAAAVISYTLLYSLYQFTVEFRRRREVTKIPKNPFKRTTAPIVVFSLRDWVWVLGIAEIYLAIALYAVYLPSVLQKLGNRSSLMTIYELNYLPFLIVVVAIVTFLSAILVGVALWSTTTFLAIYLRIMSWFRPMKKVIIDNPSETKVPQLYLGLIIVMFLVVLTSVTLSAIYAVNDASNGMHTGAWQVQRVKIISSNNNPFQQMGLSYCYADYCVSESYGLIGENDNAYILIRWHQIDGKYFPYNPGVILLPRSDDIVLVPHNYGQ